jgi:Protein of unknown function (DUF2516)
MTPLFWFFEVLMLGAFVAEGWAFIDAVRRPAAAFTAAGKLSKRLWLVILGVAAVVGLASVAYGVSLINFLPIIAFVAAAIYLADVRPRVREFKGNSGTTSGPYGPW